MFRRRRVPPPTIPRKRLNKTQGFSLKTFYQLLISVIIFAFAIFLNQTEDPLGERMVVGIEYFLSTESDVQPVLQRVVGLGLQMENMQWPFLTDFQTSKALPALGGKVETKTLKIPVSGKILRRFGWQDSNNNGYQDYHEGIDIKANKGTSVKAAEKGLVEKVGTDQVIGNYIVVDHGLELKTLYGQLEDIKVEAGQKVERGQILGVIGDGGVVGESHLHFEVREKGALVNPISKFNLQNKGI